MKLEVLGCHGGELAGCRSTCFLIDDRLALDAGALATLPIEALAKIDDVLLTHSHFDHIKDLPSMGDALIGKRDRSVTIHCSEECLESLEKHLFNGELWPNFTQIPTPKQPIFKLQGFKVGSTVAIGGYSVKSVRVTHPVVACGFVISDGPGALAISGDTGPTEELWRVLNARDDLKLLLMETSFPNAMQALADVSGHLTPRSLESELAKLDRRGCEVLLYHLKPAFIGELKEELKHLPVRVLELGDTFEF